MPVNAYQVTRQSDQDQLTAFVQRRTSCSIRPHRREVFLLRSRLVGLEPTLPSKLRVTGSSPVGRAISFSRDGFTRHAQARVGSQARRHGHEPCLPAVAPKERRRGRPRHTSSLAVASTCHTQASGCRADARMCACRACPRRSLTRVDGPVSCVIPSQPDIIPKRMCRVRISVGTPTPHSDRALPSLRRQ